MGAHSLIDWRPRHELLAPSAVDPKTRREIESEREKEEKRHKVDAAANGNVIDGIAKAARHKKRKCLSLVGAHTHNIPLLPPPSLLPLNSPWDMYAKISVQICTHYRLSKVILVDWTSTSRWLTQLPLYTFHLSFSHFTRREQFVSYL